MSSSHVERAQVLAEALPYIQKYNGKTVVVKYGGNAMISEALRKAVISDIILLHLVGIQVVVVHGGGPEINAMLKKIQKESKFLNGMRVTDQETMDKAQKAQLIKPESRKNFVSNTVVLIVPAQGKKFGSLAELKKAQRIAVGSPESVPVGRYTRDALKSAGLWETLQPSFIYGNSVRQVLDYVARGEVDAGIVYATDAKQRADKVDVCLTLTGHKPVTYPIAVATTGSNAAMGQAFVDFALSPEGQAILARYGFSKP